MTTECVSAYGVSRHYGGPEEGGWWYDWWRLLESLPPTADAKPTLREKWAHIQQEGDRFSVLGDGEDLRVVTEDYSGQFASTTRPHYE